MDCNELENNPYENSTIEYKSLNGLYIFEFRGSIDFYDRVNYWLINRKFEPKEFMCCDGPFLRVVFEDSNIKDIILNEWMDYFVGSR